MPYFKNSEINLLLIHIPKTGGTSLEKYFSKKYNIDLNEKSLYGKLPFCMKNKICIMSHLQHLLYRTIMKYKNEFKINLKDLKIIASVRNPYHRLVSDLFYYKLINEKTNKKEVYKVILKYLYFPKFDNHNIPQYLFLLNEHGEINEDITIFKTETLKNDMINYGFEDFNLNENKNKNTKINYMDYLNDDSIFLINNHFHKDFQYFDYDMLPVNKNIS
jgi:hypothetical protein